jgi:neopullulanase
MNVSTPDWVKDAVFYQIFPDRFARHEGPLPVVAAGLRLQPWGAEPNRSEFQGGNLDGIIDHLDYLLELGVNALYLNPIFASAANHRYATYDYFRVDPILGGDADFRRLLSACHANGIRIVLDGVFNHAGRGLFQFHHLLENGPASPFVDWFKVSAWPVNAYPGDGPVNYACWANVASLPKFNTDTTAVREFLWRVGEYWLEQGIDGWRLDVPDEIDDDAFWEEFRRRCRTINPDAYLVGELWEAAPRWLKGDKFDAQMNYLFTRAVFGYFVGEDYDQSRTIDMGYKHIQPLDGRGFAAELDRIANRLYHPEIALAQLNMLGSHDTPRLMTLVNEDAAAARLAFLTQMTVPGTPNIYYGDEIGMTGGGDPDCRRAFPWHAPSSWNTALLADVRRYIDLRHGLAALRRGSLTIVHADEAAVVYERRTNDELVVVALNGTKAPASFTYHGGAQNAFREELVSPREGSPLLAGRPTVLPPQSGRVWSTRLQTSGRL